MSVLNKGGRVVTAANDYTADVFVEDETVTLIGESPGIGQFVRRARFGEELATRARARAAVAP